MCWRSRARRRATQTYSTAARGSVGEAMRRLRSWTRSAIMGGRNSEDRVDVPASSARACLEHHATVSANRWATSGVMTCLTRRTMCEQNPTAYYFLLSLVQEDHFHSLRRWKSASLLP